MAVLQYCLYQAAISVYGILKPGGLAQNFIGPCRKGMIKLLSRVLKLFISNLSLIEVCVAKLTPKLIWILEETG
jgi:hypothetical protein